MITHTSIKKVKSLTGLPFFTCETLGGLLKNDMMNSGVSSCKGDDGFGRQLHYIS